MKKIFIASIGIAAFAFFACNGNSKSVENKAVKSDTSQAPAMSLNADIKADSSSVKDVVSSYLQIKNALTNDDGNQAAEGGKAMAAAIGNLGKTTLSSQEKKVLSSMQDDLTENAEHIGANANKIAHQREHFDELSPEMYDLVKAFGSGEKLYKDSCPMYNNSKGAIWLSEVKDIKNPYLGKKMPTCGSVKEELK